MIENIWNGVYESFQDVPARGTGFQGDKWSSSLSAKASKAFESVNSPEPGPSVAAFRECLLPLLAALVADLQGKVSIVDFGGGIGLTYIETIDALSNPEVVTYHVVETDRVCDAANKLFANDGRIRFHESLPALSEPVDIVHLGSSLQYVEKWREMLRDLAAYDPGYYMFTDLMAGNIRTFATAQSYYDSVLPHWFFNRDDIINQMKSLGYELTFQSLYLGKFLGKEQPLPQDNFPADLRLGRASNLIFRKTNFNGQYRAAG